MEPEEVRKEETPWMDEDEAERGSACGRITKISFEWRM